MKEKMFRSLVVAAFVLFAALAPAAAQGWGIAGTVGQSDTKDYSVGAGQPVENRDSQDTAFAMAGGYMFSKYFGSLVSYVNLGESNYSGSAYGGFTDTLKVDGWNLSGLGLVPFGSRWGGFAMLGMFRWNQEVRYRDASGPYDYDESGLSLSYGLGFSVDVVPKALGIHFEYQVFTNVGDKDNSGHEYDRSMISLGVVYRFQPI